MANQPENYTILPFSWFLIYCGNNGYISILTRTVLTLVTSIFTKYAAALNPIHTTKVISQEMITFSNIDISKYIH